MAATMVRMARVLAVVAVLSGLMTQTGGIAAAETSISCYGADADQAGGQYFLFSDGGQWYVLMKDQTGGLYWNTWIQYQAQTGVSDRPVYKVGCRVDSYPFWGHSLKIENGAWYLVYTIGSFYNARSTATVQVTSLENALDTLVYLDDVNGRPAPTDPYLACIWANDSDIDFDRDGYVGMDELVEYCRSRR
jgi:hypothetical protein